MMTFEKVLIANRGEIALRINRACKEMGIATVAIHSTADTDAMHVRLADEASASARRRRPKAISTSPPSSRPARSPAPTRSIPATASCRENARFAEIVEAHGMTFIGPKPEHIRMMGDKITAKRTAGALGMPPVPGSDGAVSRSAEAKAIAAEDRLSGADQGRRRRRRARHEGRDQRGAASKP